MERGARPVTMILCVAAVAAGCTTDRTTHTARTAKEQLLISNSVDAALDKIDFRPFDSHAVFLEEKYLEGTDKNYVVASLRHRLLYAGAALVDKADEAEIVVEVRSGSLGTDSQESFFGTPEFKAPVPAVPVSIPEVKLVSRDTQTATAKIGIVAYDAKTKRILGSGGMTMARSDDRKWFVLGMGPYQHGSIHDETRRGLTPAPGVPEPLPAQVAFESPSAGPDSSRVRLASEQEGADAPPWETTTE